MAWERAIKKYPAILKISMALKSPRFKLTAITDKIIQTGQDWQARALVSIYPISAFWLAVTILRQDRWNPVFLRRAIESLQSQDASIFQK